MENFIIPLTKKTPKVEYLTSTCVFTIEGRCIPSDTAAFFEPIIEFIKTINNSQGKTIMLEFNLEYINSTATKWLVASIKELNEKYKKGVPMEMNWYYEDDDTFDFGELLSDVADFKINRIKTKF